MIESDLILCQHCGTVLEAHELDVEAQQENLDGERGICTFYYYYCPMCGSDDLESCWGPDDGEEEEEPYEEPYDEEQEVEEP